MAENRWVTVVISCYYLDPTYRSYNPEFVTGRGPPFVFSITFFCWGLDMAAFNGTHIGGDQIDESHPTTFRKAKKQVPPPRKPT